MIQEVFKPISGFPEYFVSNLGSVKSCKYGKTRILKQGTEGKGYCMVNLSLNGIPSKHKVHRLVAEAFIENPENLPEVNHINEIRNDNRAENLEWATPKSNSNHGTRNLKISNSLSKKVVQMNLEGETIKVWDSAYAASKEGYCNSSISNACYGYLKTYKGFKWKFFG